MDIQSVILKSSNEMDLYKAARKKGMITLKEDAIIKAFNGDIEYMEVNAL
ncbi:MAG: hypothetical protein NT098_04165 [Candidatus Parcubacteria bacterium]|nr:hypothetical protein [Candidatus Parcubacteria bacterium]